MVTETIYCNHLEATEQRRRLASEKYKLEKRLQQVNRNLKIVDSIIEENDNNQQNWVVELPIEVLFRNELLSNVRQKVNWKNVVLSLFTQYEMPMSSELLYYKLFLKYGPLPFDRKFIIKNISAALHYLEAKDDKLFRVKEDHKRGYVYGLKHFFDLKLNIKPQYLKKYLMEIGKMTIA